MKTYDTIFKSFDHQEYLQVLESSGFEIISADVKERNYTHTSLEEFLGKSNIFSMRVPDKSFKGLGQWGMLESSQFDQVL